MNDLEWVTIEPGGRGTLALAWLLAEISGTLVTVSAGGWIMARGIK